jgi:hypothetical protein
MERGVGGVGLRCWVSFFAVLTVACFVFSLPRTFAVGSAEAAAAVSNAESALRGALVAVLDAENSGVNVSGLMGRMNDAGVALTGARVALAAGNYSDAVDRAGACRSLANGVLTDADVLKSDSVAWASLWWVTLLLSVTASVVFVAVLFVVWRRFRRSYAGKLLKSRPEVVG